MLKSRIEICGTNIDESEKIVYYARIEKCGTNYVEVQYGKTRLYVIICR